MRVTMVQVAGEAGVDKATVSRALKGDPRISLATRERVWEAARRLGYEPDAMAKGLSSSRSGMIAVVLRSLSPCWTGLFLEGVERVVAKGRMDFIVRSTGGQPGVRENLMRTISARRVDGLVWVDPGMPRLPGVPTVAVGFPLEGAMSVVTDLEEARRLLALVSGKAGLFHRAGPDALFPGLAGSLENAPEGGVAAPAWVFCDGTPPGEGERAILSCGKLSAHFTASHPVLVWPAFETGVIAARLLLNSMKGQQPLPDVVMVRPRLEAAEDSGLSD